MRRSLVRLVLVAAVLLLSALPVCSEKVSSPEFDIEVNVPNKLAGTLKLWRIHGLTWDQQTNLGWSGITGAGGDFTWDHGNHILSADHYYALDISGTWNSATFTGTNVTGGTTGLSLGGNILCTVVKAVTSGPEVFQWAGNFPSLINTRTFMKGPFTGGWLRLYVVIPNDSASGVAGPIPDNQPPDTYTGQIVVTVV